MAPAIAALIGIGGTLAWDQRGHLVAQLVLCLAIAASVSWGYVLLHRSPQFQPWLKGTATVVGLFAALMVAVPFGWARLTVVGVVAGVVAGLAGPTAYAVQTASVGHSGAIPSAGPATPARGGGLGRRAFGGGIGCDNRIE